jgi:hypothetical protein
LFLARPYLSCRPHSDTITVPSDELFDLMRTASRGDDVYGVRSFLCPFFLLETDTSAHRKTQIRSSFRRGSRNWRGRRRRCFVLVGRWCAFPFSFFLSFLSVSPLPSRVSVLFPSSLSPYPSFPECQTYCCSRSLAHCSPLSFPLPSSSTNTDKSTRRPMPPPPTPSLHSPRLPLAHPHLRSRWRSLPLLRNHLPRLRPKLGKRRTPYERGGGVGDGCEGGWGLTWGAD